MTWLEYYRRKNAILAERNAVLESEMQEIARQAARMHDELLRYYREHGMTRYACECCSGNHLISACPAAPLRCPFRGGLCQGNLTDCKTYGCVEQARSRIVSRYERKPDGTVQKVKPPADVHIITDKRVGDEIRDRYLEHLHLKFSEGFLSESEHDARVDAAMKAQTEKDLSLLLQDLPPLPAPVSPVVKKEEKKTGLAANISPLLAASWAAGMGACSFLFPSYSVQQIVLVLLAWWYVFIAVILKKKQQKS